MSEQHGAERDAGRIEELIEASSLGTPEARALRATVSDEHAARIVARAKEIERNAAACTCSNYFGCCEYSPDCAKHGRVLPPAGGAA